MLTVWQLDIVARTAPRMQERAREFGVAFYEGMFAARPELRDLFGFGLSGQMNRLLGLLGRVAARVPGPEALEADLAELGRAHAGLGVRSSDYAVARQAFREAILAVFGEDEPSEIRVAWVAMFDAASHAMADEARAADAPSPAPAPARGWELAAE